MPTDPTDQKIHVGDWVRFQMAGRLWIGVVQYVRKNNAYPHDEVAETDIGTVSTANVLEKRVALKEPYLSND